jgi:hypothetical protein
VHPDSPVPTARMLPARTPDIFGLDGDDIPHDIPHDIPPEPSSSHRVAFGAARPGRDTAALRARARWAEQLEALVGAEVRRAVKSGVLSDAEAEVLVAHVAIVIDQALSPDIG